MRAPPSHGKKVYLHLSFEELLAERVGCETLPEFGEKLSLSLSLSLSAIPTGLPKAYFRFSSHSLALP